MNRSRNVVGGQLAGVVNSADELSGLQLSGVVNVADRIRDALGEPFDFAQGRVARAPVPTQPE